MSEHVIRIVPKAGGLSTLYIEAFLRSIPGQDQLARGVFGSVIPEITPDHIADIEISVPRSPKRLKEIISLTESAHYARQESIANLVDGVRLLEQTLGFQ